MQHNIRNVLMLQPHCSISFTLMLPWCLQAPPTESQVVRAQADNATLSRAHQLLEEEKDEVKHMNQMVQYAKCVAVRDKQMQVGTAGCRWC
jgi:hypothetical protein